MLNHFNHNHATNVIGGFQYYNAVQSLQQQQQQQQQPQQQPHYQLKRKGPAMGFDGDLQPSLKKYAAMLSPQTALAMAASAAAAAAAAPGVTMAETEARLDESVFRSQEPVHPIVKTSSSALDGPVATLPPLVRKGAPLLPLLNPPLTLVPSYHPLQQQQHAKQQNNYYSPGSVGFTTLPSQQQPHYHSLHHQHLHQQFHQQLQQLQQQQQQKKHQQQQQQKQQRPQKSEAPKKPPRTLYCENCNEHFTNLDTHTQGPRHTAFVANEANFQSLDNVIRKVGRRPLCHGSPTDCFFDYLSNSLGKEKNG
jgi:hypothetical protein